MTATTKLMPLTSSSMPMVRRTLPETVSMPIGGDGEADRERHQGLDRRRAAHADEAREGQEIDGEIFGRPEGQRDAARSTTASKVISTTPTSAPKAAEPKAVASAAVGRPSRAIG